MRSVIGCLFQIFLCWKLVVSSIDYLSALENGRIVYPSMDEGTRRARRDLSNTVFYDAPIKWKLIKVENWVLELDAEPNWLLAPGLAAEWTSDEGVATSRPLPHCDYIAGAVRGLESVSRAVAAVCGRQITGYVHVPGADHFLQPLNASTGAHILYTRGRTRRFAPDIDLYPEDTQWIFNLTGDTLEVGENIVAKMENGPNRTTDDGLDVDGDNSRLQSPFTLREESDPEELGYFYDNAWTAQAQITHKKAGSILPPRWLEIALAVDYTLITFHGKDKVEQYVLALMNIVSAIYQDVSLEANMKLVVTRLLLYENKKQSVVRPGNAKKSLENVNSWNSRLHLSLAPGEPQHDIAVWLTRSDIGGPSGYAPVGGACDPKRSCALNRDEGLSSAFIIAHEMAHILGLTHDGDKRSGNKCADDALKGSVMAPMVAATFNKFSWSECSRSEFKKTAKRWGCLSNSPIGVQEIVLNATLQNSFSMDEQCRMEFGEGYTLCRAFDIIEPCSHLWCGHTKSPLVCKTKKGPPLEGTECGLDKWCVNGYCEEIGGDHRKHVPVVLNPQDGGWSDWSTWGLCSRSCGSGVKFRTRKCDSPAPLYGGMHCNGSDEEWKVCNERTCPEPLQDLRAQQCKRLPKLLDLLHRREANLTWLPYESDNSDRKCKLICISKETKEIFQTFENLIDGTACSYENLDNICIQGICQFVGCDGNLNSKMESDECGVCGGNNTNCSNVKSIFRRKLKREVSRVVVLSKMARNIQIEANVTMERNDDPSVAFILKNRRKKRYTMTIPNTGVHTEILEGTKFYYMKTRNQHRIWAKGPVLAEMVILLYAPISEVDLGLNVSLRSRYVINKDVMLTSKKYNWILGGWGPCSASCGGGRRQQTVACWDTQSGKLVRRKHCSLIAKPILKSEKCNTFDCNFQWIAGKWEPCSATCGLSGIQHRELYCVPQLILNRMLFKNNGTIIEEPWRYMVSPYKCSGISPVSERPCNREPCTSFWTFGEWSQCSATCGSGVSARSSFCPPPNEENFYSCDGAPPLFQRRVCQGQFNRHTSLLCRGQKKKPCKGDQSAYCSLNLLSKYCKLGGFRRLCCQSCSTFRLSPVSV